MCVPREIINDTGGQPINCATWLYSHPATFTLCVFTRMLHTSSVTAPTSTPRAHSRAQRASILRTLFPGTSCTARATCEKLAPFRCIPTQQSSEARESGSARASAESKISPPRVATNGFSPGCQSDVKVFRCCVPCSVRVPSRSVDDKSLLASWRQWRSGSHAPWEQPRYWVTQSFIKTYSPTRPPWNAGTQPTA